METMKYHHFLFFMLIGNLCFQMSRAVETTHINCETGIAEPVVIGPVEEGSSDEALSFQPNSVCSQGNPLCVLGIVETITGVPIDTSLQLVKFGFESHLQYVELNHTSGSDTAVVLTKGKLDAEDFHDTSGEIFYAIKCVKNSVLNNRILRITDINDNVPVFQLNNYSVTVSEAHQVGVSIIKVIAEDRDTSPENNRITYSIVPPAPSEFEVQARDGAILLKSPLNYNRASSYSFNVKAQDPKNESSQTNVAITVTDYDNMSPYFSHSLYSATIPEHKTGELSTVHPAAIEAKDGDLGLNTPVSYSITTVTPQEYTSSFNISEDNGIVSVLTALDRELIETVEINIKASQRDDSLKTADATVFVKIEDVNDNPPEFDKQSYTVNITENSPNGTVILQVKVTDRDEGGFRGVLRITPEDSPFEISADGVITVENSIALDREKRTSFFLQIVAKEDSPPQREQTVNVLVHLLDENDNSPSFDSSEYVGKVFKNQTVGMTVVKVEAVDPDQDANGQVKYKIDAGNQDTYFHIDPDTGVITLLKEIVLEENRMSHFLLHVRATDGGEVPRASSVAVDIRAPGDSNPQFLKPTYEGTVLEEQDAPVQIVKVDFMSLNPVVPATLKVLTDTDKFEIDKNGVISTKVKLDYESHRNHSITISISDGMSEDLGNVIVKVVDINDNSPVFAGSYPDVALSEAAENGTVVANMVAMDVDDGFNAEISFALQGSEGNFDIDPRTGQITLVKELDREVKAKYNLIAIARDQGQPSKSSTVAFGVNVVDVNDNYPVFSLARYEVEIPEDMSVGNAVLNVTAVDLDEGPNSVVEYRIVGQTPSDPLVFTLDRVSGALSLSSPLNFEIVRQYILTVEAKDGGSPSLQSTCSVLIRVLDVNDNPPQFDEDEYHISVYETIPSGAAVFTVSVTDKDEDGFSKGHFILNSSTFNMNNQGTLSLNSDASLDREEKSNYILMVVAVDRDAGGLSSSAVLNITVLDVNDNNPQFITLPQNINIAEGNYHPDAPGEICQIGAIDFDEGENGHVTLSVLSADATVLFQFQKDGTLVAVAPLDREIKDLYEMVIVASDNGIPQRKNVTDIKIKVTDINDNAPKFTKSSYTGSVLVANAKEGDKVLTVSAQDPDIGNNSKIIYRFSNVSPHLNLDGDTGVISLASDLSSVTENTMINLTVIASDHGEVPLSSAADMVQLTNEEALLLENYLTLVLINLVTDNSVFGLKFESAIYNFSIKENESEKTSVGTVKAVTGSLIVKVNYTIKSYPDCFFIDTHGSIMTLQELDREQQELYTVAVEAVDSRSPPNTALTVVTIQVKDVNDNAPEFSTFIQTHLSATEGQESIEAGYFTATDRDIGDNGRLSYSLLGDFNGTFRVNSSTGRLRITQPLDRETEATYLLTIMARDAGTPPLSSSLTVNIAVEDVNDHAPVFNQTAYEVTVKENEIPADLLTVFATDDDIGYNAIINYVILETSVYPFYIGELTGRIGIVYPLDYEKGPQYTFTVRAYNPGTDLEDTALVTVKVEDVNEEGPVFDDPFYSVFLRDNSTAGQLVLDINATHGHKENDAGIYYNISEGNGEGLFSLSSTTGKLTLTKDLTPTSVVKQYSLTVMATDYGTPQLSSTAKVTVMIITRNLEMPVFSAELYSPQPLSEKTQPDTVVMQAHVFYTSTVMYSIQSGNDNDYFTMDTFSGVIKTKQALDVSHFPAILIIRATHSNQSLVYGEAKVNITVVDENDFPPVFPNSSVTVFVKENENASLQILRLNATDEDIGQNGELQYAILSGDEDYFRIDALTGALHTKVSFDFESDPVQYQIVVYAEDNGIPEKKRGYCTVFISITDINDNPPVFDSVPLMTVRENTKAGIYIGRVRATDKDTGDNAFIAYNITEGGEDFSVDDYGNITVKRSPDYEDKIEIIITVTATNNKTVPFYETKTEVRISVLDENDNPPLFTKNNYTARVNLTSPAGTLVTSVAATDQDTGNNAVVEYYLLDHEPESKYFIIEDMLKGTIMTIRSLPHPGIYELSVEARDRGYPARNSSARVTVAVIDNSPFQPHFNQSEISVDVEENTGTKFLVYTFSVLDTPNAHVSYTIRSGNELDHFQLNPNTGALYTSVNLDFENFSKYFITVEAIGPLSHAVRDGKNIARLTILVKDVNEVPKFSQESYSASIFNIAPYKSPVVQVRAFDQDSGVNGLLEYSLIDSQSQEFDVDGSTGEIYVVSVEGETGESAFKVQAKDQNGKGLAAVTTVKVTLVSSSSDDVVVISINQAVNNVEKKKYEVKKALEKALGWDVHIISINGISSKMRLAKSNEETFFTFLATDNDKIMPSEEVKSKLESSEDRIQADLEVVFGEDVVHTVKDQFEDFALSSDQTSVIVLSVLLALTISGFVAFLVVTLLRNRKLKKESDPYKDTLSFGISYPNVFQQTEHQENMKNTEEQM